MKPKTLMILAGVTAALVGLAVVTQRGGAARTSAFAPAPLAPGLAESINDAARLTLRKGDREVVLERRAGTEAGAGTGAADGWVVASKGGYPARFQPVKELLVSLSQARKVEEKTKNPARYADIGVDEPPEGGGTLVTVEGPGGTALASLVLGNAAGPAGKEQTVAFVRPAGQEQSFLARAADQGRLSASVDAMDWIERQVLTLDRPRVSSVVITQKDGSSVRLTRASRDQAEPTLEGVPPGRELKFPGIAGQAVGVLSFVSIDDVRPAGGLDRGGEGVSTAEFRTFDGLVLTLTNVPADGKTWSIIEASADEAVLAALPENAAQEARVTLEREAAAKASEPAPGGEAGPAAAPAVDAEALTKAQDAARAAAADQAKGVRDEAAKINRAAGGWAFDLGSWRVENLTARMAYFLKEPPPDAPDPPNSPNPPDTPAAPGPGLPPPPGGLPPPPASTPR
jgi:hypothetical protein